MITASSVKSKALELGFDLCGIAPAENHPELAYLREWLDRGYAGDMSYMARTAARRADVRHVLPSARSVIVLAVVYNVDRPYSTELIDPGEAQIARYAWGDDYHDVLAKRLDALVAWMCEADAEPFEARAYVDTGPVQERVYAQHAGLGWIGKNTCLINPELGSWVFLSEIVCSLDLEPDEPGFDRCGTCTLCIEECPTGAIVEPRKLDATRCLSYLTIEHKGRIPVELRDKLGRHAYGCDVCQDVCPWNQITARSERREWMPRPALDRPRLLDLWQRSDRELTALLRRSPLKRPKLTGLRRNLAVALGNSGDAGATAVLARDDGGGNAPSKRDPLVAEHIAWARRKLTPSLP
jgi:epoxyqueuosine reductase